MRISFISVVVPALFFAGEAFAFHPLTGEDTLFLGRDARQVEAGLEHTVSKEGADRYSTGASAELSYGLLEKLDMMVTVPWQGWHSHGISESGLGDVLLEVKFLAAQRNGWSLAAKPGFSLPAGNEARSLGAGKGGVWVYGIAGRAAGPWQFYLNAGYLLNRNSSDERENIIKGSAAAGLGVLPKLRIAAEFAAQTNPDKSSSSHPLTSVFGLVWSPHPALALDAGARFGLTRSADQLGLLLGFTLRL